MKIFLYLLFFITVISCHSSIRQNKLEQESPNFFIYNFFNTSPKELTSTFLINNKKDTVIVGNQGTQIYIPKDAFNVGFETVELRLIEFYELNDIFTYGLTTNHNNGILITAGMVFISASIKNSPINLDEDGFLKIYFNKKYFNKEMQPFIANIIDDRLQSNQNFYWEETDQITVGAEHYGMRILDGDTVKTPDYDYAFFKSKSLGWINADIFYEYNEPKEDLIVSIDTTFQPVVRMVFKDMKSILSGTKKNDIYVFENVPVGKEVILIAFGKIGNNHYWARKQILTRKNQTEELKLNKAELTEIRKGISDI